MIRSESQQREIAADGLTLSHDLQNMSPKIRELLAGTEYRDADITFNNRYELDLGGVTVVMTSVGPAHTLGDTAYHVVEDKVLFAGELMVNSVPNLFSQFSHIENWSASLDKLAELNAEIIVPSHGELVDLDTKTRLQEFLADLLTRTTELNTGTVDRAGAAETLKKELSDKYADWVNNLNPDYFDRIMQAAAGSAFKTLDRRPPAGPEAN
jgi:glyoxylase-like metal-dependent hydrolase (beta-lactamase superfamily II)